MSYGQTSDGGETLVANGRFYAIVTNNTGNLVFTRKGDVCRILVTVGTGSVSVYDGTSASGTLVWTIAATTIGAIYEVMVPGLQTGLFVQPGASTTVTVTYA